MPRQQSKFSYHPDIEAAYEYLKVRYGAFSVGTLDQWVEVYGKQMMPIKASKKCMELNLRVNAKSDRGTRFFVNFGDIHWYEHLCDTIKNQYEDQISRKPYVEDSYGYDDDEDEYQYSQQNHRKQGRKYGRRHQNVALCYKNLQIEGVAEIKGSPLLESNKALSNKYRAKQPKIYDRVPWSNHALLETIRQPGHHIHC